MTVWPGCRRIGIDEISYKRGFKFLMVVVDHNTRRLGWAAPGRTSATVGEFFDLLGENRCAQITHVSADGADFIDTLVADRCPGAVRVADPFHVVKGATDALDEVRRGAWNDARAQARTEPKRQRGRPRADAPPRPGNERAKALKWARYSLWKNPQNLTENQQIKLAWIAATNPRMYRAYLLKEGLRGPERTHGSVRRAREAGRTCRLDRPAPTGGWRGRRSSMPRPPSLNTTGSSSSSPTRTCGDS